MTDDVEAERFAGPDEFRAWLADNHASSPGIWLALAKKGSGVRAVSYAEALQVALAFGWIDGKALRLDDDFYLQRFTPRRPRSPWSQRNCRFAEALIEAGEMMPSGLAEVERARADGRWERAYDGPRTAEAHPDFLAALERSPAAAEFFATLTSRNRFAIYYRIQDAKRDDTRARRIESFVAMLERHETIY